MFQASKSKGISNFFIRLFLLSHTQFILYFKYHVFSCIIIIFCFSVTFLVISSYRVYSRQNYSFPQMSVSLFLNPVNVSLHDKRYFTDVTKLRTLVR